MDDTVPNLHKVETQKFKPEQTTGMATGLKYFDDLTSGLQHSDLIIIASRPGMGKTSFALTIARYVSIETKKTVAIFSLEMTKEQIISRLLATETKIDVRDLQKGCLNMTDWSNLSTASWRLSEVPLFIDDTPSMTIREIANKARILKEKADLCLIIVDYIQLMRSGEDHDSLAQEMSAIGRLLKALARDLKIPVIALSQIDRQVENRINHRPQIVDLRRYGTIEQDADVIAFLYREEMYNKSDDNQEKGTTEIIIAKQRNGRIGTTKIAFLDKFIGFEDLR